MLRRPLPILALFSMATALRAQTLILPPTADATTNQTQPTLNAGTAIELGFGKDFTYTPSFQTWFLRTHVLFDLTPAQQTGRWPTRATFHWFQNRASAAGCLDVTIHRLLQPFVETAVTWQNQPPHDAAAAARACVGDSFANGWKEADITDLVQAWLGGTPNFGFVIRDPSEMTAGAARPGFAHSREVATPSLAPYLRIEFADRFGFGCSQRALLPLVDVIAGSPRLGGTFTLGVTALLPGSLIGLALGTSNTTWSGGTLPWSLDPLGFQGCQLLVSPEAFVVYPPVAGIDYSIAFYPPAAPQMAGQAIYLQVFALPPAPGPGLEASQGVGVMLRN